jgi:hypothetical protein
MKHSRKTVEIRKQAAAFRETRTFHQELQAIARGLKNFVDILLNLRAVCISSTEQVS